MKSFNVVVTVSTTICVDANTPEDAIKKVQKALDANDAGTAMQLGENLSCALRDGGYSFEERKAFWDSFLDFKVPKLLLPVKIAKRSGCKL